MYDYTINYIFFLVNSKFVSTNGQIRKRVTLQLSPLCKSQFVMVMSDLPNGKALAKCFFIEENNKFTLNQRICSFSAKGDNISRFLMYQINRNKYYMRFDDGINQTNLKKNEVLLCPVFIPSIKEQEKIATLFRLLDERIATQNKIIEKLQSLISGLNDFLHLQVGGLPTSFMELGISYSGLSGKSGDDFGKGKPYITYLNIYSNSIVNEEQVDYVVIGDNEKQNTLLYGDLLFTLSSETPDEVGIGAVYLGESDKYYLNSFCFGLHMTATNKVYSPYLAYLVSNSVFRK